MNDNGYKAKAHLEGGGSRMRLGHFTVDNLQAIIRNKAYIGIKTYTQKGEQKEAKAVWQPLVNEMIFQRANERLTKIIQDLNHSKKPASIHIYFQAYVFVWSAVTTCQESLRQEEMARFLIMSIHGQPKEIPH